MRQVKNLIAAITALGALTVGGALAWTGSQKGGFDQFDGSTSFKPQFEAFQSGFGRFVFFNDSGFVTKGFTRGAFANVFFFPQFDHKFEFAVEAKGGFHKTFSNFGRPFSFRFFVPSDSKFDDFKISFRDLTTQKSGFQKFDVFNPDSHNSK